MKGRLLGKFGNKIRWRLKPGSDKGRRRLKPRLHKGRRRLKPRLHKRSLPPQTEENKDKTAVETRFIQTKSASAD